MYRYPDNFIKLYEKSFRQNANLPALSLYGRPGAKSYLHLAANIARVHILFEEMGLKRGDKIALYAKDTDVWVEAFMSVITYGATVVPVLPDFVAEDAVNIINHSGARLLMTDDSRWKSLDFRKLADVECVLSLSRPELYAAKNEKKMRKLLDNLGDMFATVYPQGFTAEDIHYPQVDNNAVVVLNYTSGTTGFSKGVMLTGWNLAGNVVFGLNEKLHYPRSRVLTFLPMAHAYGCTFDMLLPLAAGSHITVLGRIPTPAVLLAALQQVRPNVLLSVPLVFEKIYRKKIEPLISTPKMQRMLAMPGVRALVHRTLRSRLMKVMGGNLDQVIIGGAALGTDTEEFLRMIKFPYTVGYDRVRTPHKLYPCRRLYTRFRRPHASLYHGEPRRQPGPPFHSRRDTRTWPECDGRLLQERESDRRGPGLRGMATHRRYGYPPARRHPLPARPQQDHDSLRFRPEYLS